MSDVGRRCLQLLNKTNQWNLNGEKVDEQEFCRAVGSGRAVLAHGNVEDATTVYGTVAVAIIDPEVPELSHMAVSCRVIGMGIDDAFAAQLIDAFGPLSVRAKATDRNRAAQDFLQRRLDGGRLSSCPAPVHVEVLSTLRVPVAGVHPAR